MGILEGHSNYMLIPTLRIIMTNECNGKCFFCHREGNILCKTNYQRMDLETISKKIVPAIKHIGIKKVIFTGGEPTMHEDLPEAIRMVKTACEDVQVGVTTNGYNVECLLNVIDYIDRITISISSLNKDVYMRYTTIDPLQLVKKMQHLDSVRKSVSIVITEENIDEIENLITLYAKHSFDIKLQFVISQSKNESNWERKVIKKLFDTYGRFDISIGANPVLYRTLENNVIIKIKLASLNTWMYENIFGREACTLCDRREECVERGCSIRIYPDGTVTPCLNQFKSYTSDDVIANLEAAYQAMQIV